MAYNLYQCFILLKSGENKILDIRTKSTRKSKVRGIVAKGLKLEEDEIVLFQMFRKR